MATTLKSRIVTRNDTWDNWETQNPVLLKGEIGYCPSVTGCFLKVGDGTTAWKDLAAFYLEMVVWADHAPSNIETASRKPGTIWIDEQTATMYLINSLPGIGHRAEKVVTDANIAIFKLMQSTIYAKESGAGESTGYVDKALKADKLTTARTISLTGDVTGSRTFDGSANAAIAATLKDSGVAVGSYTKVTVNAKGLVTGGASLAVTDIPQLPTSKITGLGTAAGKDTGTVAGQIPVLETGGKLPESMLPALAISEPFEAGSQAAMLALVSQKGDVCIRTDENKSYILGGTGIPSVLANWKLLRSPTDAVLSVNGKVGAVTLKTSDVAEGGSNQYFTAPRVLNVLGDTANTFILDGGNA